MQRFVLSLLVLFFAQVTLISGLNGQSKIDSLVQVRETVSRDTLKVRTDILLGRAFEGINFDSALYYYQRAFELANGDDMKQYPFFKGMSLENIGFTYIYGKRETLHGLTYLKRALSSHLMANLLSEANKTEYNIGFFYASISMYDSALFHYNQVIDRHSSTSSMDRLHESYNNAGLMYFYKGQYALSAEYLTKGIRLKEERGEIEEIQHSYINLGITFFNLGEYEKAKSYYKQSNVLNSKLGNKNAVATGYRNIAEVLVKQDSLDVAMVLFEKAGGISKETGNQIGVSMYYNGLAAVFERKENYDYAIENYQLAFDYFTESVNDRYSSSVMNSLGRTKLLWLKENSYLNARERDQIIREVIRLGQESWKRSVRSDLINRKLSAAEVLKSGYEKSGDYKKALQYADSAFVFTNVINGRAQSQAIAFATTEYETERVENENAMLQETQKAQTARLKQQNFVIYGIIIGLVLIIIIAALIYRSRLNLKKANQMIEKSLSEKELLLKEIHHRVKNNLQVVSSLLDLQSRGIEDEKALSTFMEGQNRVKAMALIHQKLYQNEDLATINFAEYAENLMKELSTIYPSSRGVKTSIETNGEVQFDIDTAIPLGLILNELISNAYKYAFEEDASGGLHIAVDSLGKGKHKLTVSDTGAGLPQAFEFANAKSLGLRLVRRLAKQLYGSATYSYDAGAKFVIIFTDTIERKAI